MASQEDDALGPTLAPDAGASGPRRKEETDALASAPTLAATSSDALASAPTLAARSSDPNGRPAMSVEQPGRYDRLSELGRGGMGRVVLALDRHLDREIAMKELLAAATSEGVSIGAVARFVREARITGKLEHPAIVPVHELGHRGDGTIYYTMKRIRGASLSSALAAARTLEARLALLGPFRAVCQAVAYAHSHGVVHRDLKPDNVMVGELGETLVVDWGLAKVRGEDEVRAADVESRISIVAGDDSAKTIDGHAIGTPAYMSPEQARGDLASIDERSDVWGLGTILFQILTGRTPFVGTSPMEVVSKVLTDAPPPVRSLAPDAPAELAAIADRALQRARDARYASALELERDVAAWQDGRAVLAYSYSSWELVRRFVRRHRAATIAALSILVAIVVASAMVLRSYVEEQAARRLAEERAEQAITSDRQARIALADALLERAIRALDAGDPAAAAIYAAGALVRDPVGETPRDAIEGEAARVRSESARSVVLDAEEARAHVFERRLRVPSTAAISPDGVRLAAAHDRGIEVIDLARGTREVIELEGVELVLAFVGNDRVVVRGSPSGIVELGTARVIAPVMPGSRAAVAGDRIVISDRDGLVAIYDVEGHELDRFSTEHRGSVRMSVAGDRVALIGRDLGVASFVSLPRDPASAPLAIELAGWTRWIDLSPDGSTAAIGIAAPGLTLVDLRAPEVQRALPTHGWVNGVRWLDAQTLVIAEEDEAVIRRSGDGAAIETLRGGHTVGARLLAAGPRIVLLSQEESVPATVYREVATAGRREVVLPEAITGAHWDGARVIAITARRVLVVGEDGHATEIARLPREAGLAVDTAIAPDGAIAIYTTHGDVVLIEPGREPRVVLPSSSRSSTIGGVAIDPTGDLVVASDEDTGQYRARRYSRREGRILAPLEGHQGFVRGVAISEDGASIATASGDGSVRVWDRRGAPQHILVGHDGLASHAAFSPDGQEIATADGHGWIRVFSLATGELRIARRVHSDWVNRLTWRGDRITSASDDGTVRLLDAATLHVLRIVRLRGATNRAELAGDRLITSDGARVIEVPVRAIENAPEEILRRAEEAGGVRLEGLELVPAD